MELHAAADLGQEHVDGRAFGVAAATVAVATATGCGRSGRRDRGRGYAELLLERLDPLGELENRDALQLLDPVLG